MCPGFITLSSAASTLGMVILVLGGPQHVWAPSYTTGAIGYAKLFTADATSTADRMGRCVGTLVRRLWGTGDDSPISSGNWIDSDHPSLPYSRRSVSPL